jgi:hypothetical protein
MVRAGFGGFEAVGGSLDFDPGPWEAWDMDRRMGNPILRLVFRILY